MDISSRTVLIVGGTSGIGLGLARRFAAAGSTVVVGGRTPKVEPSPLSRDHARIPAGDSCMITAEEGERSDLETIQIDVADAESVRRARDEVLARHPDLDVVVTMAGVMLVEDLRDPAHIAQAETTVTVNLLGTVRVLDAFTPHLIERGGGTLVTVTSGIAFLPFPLMPTYAATKAGVHAYTEALRAQLAGTGVEVTEIVPPAVATAGQEQLNPAALPLEGFLDEVVDLMSENPTPNEILVKGVLQHRWAERDGTYAELVHRRSQALGTLPGR